ncbi:hypothetical protein FRX31_035533, partial [Thalictrum thalictroides]
SLLLMFMELFILMKISWQPFKSSFMGIQNGKLDMVKAYEDEEILEETGD